MKTLIHLCKKDFTHAKPWIIGVWLSLVFATLLQCLSATSEAALPFMMIAKFTPALMIFLTSTRIIHCDSFTGTSGFMRTRPVRGTTLLQNKIVFIALILVLPAVTCALLGAVCLRVQLSPSDYLLLFIEKWLYFSLIATVAVAYAVISPNIIIMVFFILATPLLFLMSLAIFDLNWPFGKSLEDQHLRASFQLTAQAFLAVAALAIAMNWAAKRRIWQTVVGFVLCGAFMTAPGVFWKWNFVDALSKDAVTAEIISEKTALSWLDEPRLVTNQTRDSIPHSRLIRTGQVTGLKDGWIGKPVNFQSEALFSDGTIRPSTSDSMLFPIEDFAPYILPQIGIVVPENHLMWNYEASRHWTLYECEKPRLKKLSDRHVSVAGIGNFQLYQPYILGEIPATAGASVINGRFRYRLDSVSATGREVSYKISIRGVALTSRGDKLSGTEDVKFIFANPATGKFTSTRGSGGSNRVGSNWIIIRYSVPLDQQRGTPNSEETKAFLKDARLYIIGTRYGGNISLPYEIPEILLEEKH